jgi:hypothetical protein
MPADWYTYPDEPLIAHPEDHGCKRFTGKVAIVTASTLGIGLAIGACTKVLRVSGISNESF